MAQFYNFKRTSLFPTLKELCIQSLIDNKHALGDVGDIPSSLLKPVLAHCTPDELQKIEDQTMERSGRDIRWDTWQIWKRIYVSKYGKPNPDEVPELKATLNEDIDPDHLPEGLGDYRVLYDCKCRKTEAQRRRLAERLRKMKKKEQLSKEKTKAKRVDAIFSIKKSRTKTAVSKGRSSTHSTPSSSAQDFYSRLGMFKKSVVKRR